MLGRETTSQEHECLYQVFHIALNNFMGTSNVLTYYKCEYSLPTL